MRRRVPKSHRPDVWCAAAWDPRGLVVNMAARSRSRSSLRAALVAAGDCRHCAAVKLALVAAGCHTRRPADKNRSLGSRTRRRSAAEGVAFVAAACHTRCAVKKKHTLDIQIAAENRVRLFQRCGLRK